LSLTAKDVAEIMRVLEESSFDSLSLEMDGIKLNLQRFSPKPSRASADVTPPATSVPTAQDVPATKSMLESGLQEIHAPLLGIFHRSPKPGAPPFVEIGSTVEEETVVGIIEVMKLMNPVPAGVKGEVVEISIENGAAVEYGQTLMRVRSKE
jgi:acetyl-CoA carboxylase biotin carboxyl carrier protein